MVVAVVSRIGRSRARAAASTASRGAGPLSSISMRMRSISTMALLMTIPDREMIPSSVTKPKSEPVSSNPATTPRAPSVKPASSPRKPDGVAWRARWVLRRAERTSNAASAATPGRGGAIHPVPRGARGRHPGGRASTPSPARVYGSVPGARCQPAGTARRTAGRRRTGTRESP
jgi:hypothetical protein